jgi:hypothetical protein
MHDFEAVASGARQRVRWLSADGWVRVDRLSEQRLCVRGPRREVVRLSSVAQNEWSCLHQRQFDGGMHGTLVELMLIRREPEFTSSLQPQQRDGRWQRLG